jgi:uncharacterized membrane protein required for colicin V production
VDIVTFVESFRLFDLLFIAVLAVAFVIGFIQGTIRRLLGTASIIFSFLLAASLRDALGKFFASNWFQFPSEYSYMLAFAFIFAVAAIAFSLLIQGLYKHQPLFARATFVDEALGGTLGVIQGMLIMGFVIIILDSFFRIPAIPQTTGELPFLRTLWSALNDSGTASLYRQTLIPGFFTIAGVFIPADVRSLY